jgi:hypothetical protein
MKQLPVECLTSARVLTAQLCVDSGDIRGGANPSGRRNMQKYASSFQTAVYYFLIIV